MKKLSIIFSLLFSLLCSGIFQSAIAAAGPDRKPERHFNYSVSHKKVPPIPGIITVTVTLSGTPNYGTHLDTCDLKYDKWGHFDLTQDDRGTGALDAAIVRGGGTASNSVVYAPITYTDGANVNGKSWAYTGTVASNSWVNTDSAGDWHFAAPFYMDWPAMKTMIDKGWAIADHGAFHGIDQSGAVALGFTPIKNCFANRNYIFRQSLARGSPFVTRTGVVPSADSGYQSVYEQMGYIVGVSENAFDNYTANPAAEYINNACAIVTNYKYNNKFYVQARQFKDLNAVDAVSYWETFLAALISQSTSTVKNSMAFGIHAYDITNDKTICDYLHSNANDHILVCSLQEMYEYWETIWKTNITQSLSGNTLTVTLDQRFLPDDMRWRDMSFKLKSNVSISSVSVSGADDYSYNTSTGLINIYKRKTSGFAFPPYYTDMPFQTGKINLEKNDLIIDNNNGDYRDTNLHINVEKGMLVDGSTTYQYHPREFDGAMIYTPYNIITELSDYGATVDTFGVYRSGASGFTTWVIAIRNDNDQPDTLGSWSSGSGWIYFKGRGLSKRYVTSRIVMSSNSTAGFPNEIYVSGTHKPYTEQVYPHRHSPLGQMLGVNTYVWDMMNSFTPYVDETKVAAFNSLGLRSARFYVDESFYSQQSGATWSFNPIGLGYNEENLFRRLKADNPYIIRWNVLQGQLKQVKQSWRDNPINTYQIKGVVTAYSSFGSYGTVNLNVFFTTGAGGGPSNWRIENLSRPSAPKQYPEGTQVFVPTSLPSPVTFYIGPGLSSDYQVGDTVWARMVETSQINIMYGNNSIAGRNTLTSWDSASRLSAMYTSRRGRNMNAPRFLPYLGNNDSVGVNVADWTENLNEDDAAWDGYNNYLSGESNAYLWSNVYDHNKVWSSTFGVKNMDTSMKVSTTGLAINVVDPLQAAEITSRKLRGYRPMADVSVRPNYWKATTQGLTNFPADVIQMHSYFYTGGNDQYAHGINGGLPFELSPSVQQIKDQVWFRDKYTPNALVDIGEWGYDTHSGSPINVPAIGSHDIEQTRGAWSARAILKMNVLGVDYAQWYRLYSYDSTGTQFSTMDLLDYHFDNNTISRTLVGNYFAQISEFGNYVYDSTLRDDSLQVFRFKNGSNFLYAIWAIEKWTNQGLVFYQKPTFQERTGTYNLPLLDGTSLTVRTLQDEGTSMGSASGTAGPSGYAVNYSLTPVFIQTSGGTSSNQPPISDAGSDQTITLPTTSTILIGSGSDPDGTIASVHWTKISGPSCTIVSPNSNTTSVTGLSQGVYVFQFTVTDNSGFSTSDNVQVIVNPAGYVRQYTDKGKYKKGIIGTFLSRFKKRRPLP